MNIKRHLAIVLSLSMGSFWSGLAAADPMQRVLTIHNSSSATIWPVIEADQAHNCTAIGGLRRIIVNKDVKGAGIPAGATVDVAIPKDYPCARGGFYSAARVIALTADFDAFEQLSPVNQRTGEDPAWDSAKYPLCAGCWAGIVQSVPAENLKPAGYGLDAPAQLMEFTIISMNPATGGPFDDPNDAAGRSQIDFDLSYVDSAYLPVSMGLGDGGATQFMGSMLPPTEFTQRLTNFLGPAGWGTWAAWDETNWATQPECPVAGDRPTNPNKTSFSCLLVDARADVLPSAAQTIKGVYSSTGPGASLYYAPSWDGVTPMACKPPDVNGLPSVFNVQCWAPLAEGGSNLTTGDCCPVTNAAGTSMLGCCDQSTFIIDRTTRRFSTATKSYRFENATFKNLVQRFTAWQGTNNPCAEPAVVAAAPVIEQDKMAFCVAYKKTIDYLWKRFQEPGNCTGRGDALDKCIVDGIIGFTLKSDFDSKACAKCPNNDPSLCPDQCGRQAQANASTQALQRGLPWTPYGDAASCPSCPGPSSTCPTACSLPTNNQISKDAKLWFEDKFLHFWADYTSPYNVNPYARLIHNKDDGLYSPGAYSFSIDDFYGNYGGFGSTLIVDVGGTGAMQNPEPYDPFKQYTAAAGAKADGTGGWQKLLACGRPFEQPRGQPAIPLGNAVSFWKWNTETKKSDPVPTCEVLVYPSRLGDGSIDESKYFAFQLQEATYSAVDKYTGLTQTVKGLKGVWASRVPAPPPIDPDDYCHKNSSSNWTSAQLDAVCGGANIAPAGGNHDYVGITNDACAQHGTPNDPTGGFDPTCGKPLISLNIPGRPPNVPGDN